MSKKKKTQRNLDNFEGDWSNDSVLASNLDNAVGDVELPDVPVSYNESLESKSDEDLYSLDSHLKRVISKERNSMRQYEAEVNLCYVQREIGIRLNRSAAAAKFAETNSA